MHIVYIVFLEYSLLFDESLKGEPHPRAKELDKYVIGVNMKSILEQQAKQKESDARWEAYFLKQR